MSIFFPYSPSDVLSGLSTMFNITLSSLSDYQMVSLTIACNLYFFIFWAFMLYFSLKIFNRIWERLF